MFVALDIETLEKPMPEGMVEEYQASIIEGLREKYAKEDTVQKHLAKQTQQFKDRWKFTREGAQVLCVGLVGDGCPELGEPDFHLEFCADNEFEVVFPAFTALKSLDTRYGIKKIFTFNGDKFDLPILLAAATRNKIPLGLSHKMFCDLMKWPYEIEFGMISLERLAKLYGVEWPEINTPGFQNPTGADVAAMWEADQKDSGRRVIDYCLADCAVTLEIARRIGRVFPW